MTYTYKKTVEKTEQHEEPMKNNQHDPVVLVPNTLTVQDQPGVENITEIVQVSPDGTKVVKKITKQTQNVNSNTDNLETKLIQEKKNRGLIE